MTIGVTIAGKHSLKDLCMYLTEADIGFPEVRTNYVDVPGRDGQLDLSASLDGEIHYQNRTISLTFVSTSNLSGLSWPEFLSRLASLLHGQKVTLTFDGDPGWYYSGRGAISGYAMEGNRWTVQLEFTCDPWRYKTSLTEVTASLTTSDTELILACDRRPVVPTITVSAETVLTWGTSSYTVNAGSHRIPGIRLTQGIHTLKARTTAGTGTIAVSHQEGCL